MTFVAGVARLAVAVFLLAVALDWRSPTLVGLRPWVLAGLVAGPFCLILAEIWTLEQLPEKWTPVFRRKCDQATSLAWRLRSRIVGALSVSTLALAAMALLSTVVAEGHFQWMRQQVLGADPRQLERLGRHVIVGYRDADEIRALTERRAIAGVFLAARNVTGRSAAEIRQEIDVLQAIRRQQGLSPLWIATDQEGGVVSRLSPPLARLPPISEIVERHPDRAARQAAIRQFAAAQGHELAGLGVNLNFAPVVDLNHGIVNPNDRYTRIGERAISRDPALVTEVAAQYCAALLEAGVRCTLKHFPGLGRVYEDTHREGADLTTPLSELAVADWVPFRSLIGGPFTMLGHARLLALDRDRPVSFSQPVVAGLLRDDWKHDGVLITDDFSMGAVYRSRDGVAGGSVAALNAGVDLILISFDTDLYYPAMHALLTADRAGQLQPELLERSDRRLGRARLAGESPAGPARAP